MTGWREVVLTQERMRDLWREAEKEHLVQQVRTESRRAAIFQNVKRLILGLNKNNGAIGAVIEQATVSHPEGGVSACCEPS
jgi:hypothetical protein